MDRFLAKAKHAKTIEMLDELIKEKEFDKHNIKEKLKEIKEYIYNIS